MKRISLGLVERKTLLSFPRTHFDNHCSPWFLSSHVLQSKWNPYVSDSLTLNSSKCSCRSFLKFEQFLNHTSSLWLYLAIIILNYLKNFTNLCGLIHIIMLSFGNKQTVQIFSQINPYYSFCSLPFGFHWFSGETEGIWPAKKESVLSSKNIMYLITFLSNSSYKQ